jgi:hypothetical protein
MTRKALIIVAAAVLCQVVLAQHSLQFGDKSVSRTFAYGPGWKTVRLACPADGWKAETESDELAVALQGGPDVTGADWRLVGEPKQTAAGGAMTLTVMLASEKAPGLEATITYRVQAGKPWMRKEVTLAGPAGLVVTQVDLEPMTVRPAPADHGGEGMPILVDGRAWFGVEYPASQNAIKGGRMTLTHFPGRALGGDGFKCKTAVWGVAKPGQSVAMAFEDYLETIAVPPRDFVHYNTWYDLQQTELTPKRLLDTYAAFRQKLLEPYNLKMAAFVIDDGWQAQQSIWQPRKDIYPEGLKGLAQALEAGGTRLGLWMPFSGVNLDIGWGVKQGYEASSYGNWYCLGAPKFHAAMKQATADRIHEGNLAYYKHDFNCLACAAAGHEHLADPAHGHEMNVDRTIDLLMYERQVQPGIFLNVTSGMWYSPWWLMSADAIWGDFPGDTGYERSWPQLTPREWEMGFRDGHLYRVYRERTNNLFPISRLMTHGITQGRYNMLGGENEPLREWSDAVMMYFGRGVQMKELYLSPERMRDDMWKPVGLGLRWAQARSALLARTVMVGGDPRKGEPYGFTHWRGDEGVWLLRNPGLDEATMAVPIDQASGYRGAAKTLYAAVTYPYAAALARTATAGRAYEVKLPPRSVVVVEVGPKPLGKAAREPEFDLRHTQEVADTDKGLRAEVKADVKAGKMRDARLYVVLRDGAMGKCEITAPGLGKRQSVAGLGWQMEVAELSELPAHFEAALELPRGEPKAFSRTGRIEAWVVCEVEAEKTAGAPVKDPAWAIADGWRRRSVKLVDYAMAPPKAGDPLTDEQIAGAQEAALHMDVWGVNAGEYADKWVIINESKVARVPFNDQNAVDQWEEKIVPLTGEQIKLLKRENAIVFTNETGDCYKVRNIALAVKLRDGRWVESEWDRSVYCSTGAWAYTEGKVFEGARSAEIKVRFR